MRVPQSQPPHPHHAIISSCGTVAPQQPQHHTPTAAPGIALCKHRHDSKPPPAEKATKLPVSLLPSIFISGSAGAVTGGGQAELPPQGWALRFCLHCSVIARGLLAGGCGGGLCSPSALHVLLMVLGHWLVGHRGYIQNIMGFPQGQALGLHIPAPELILPS